MTEPHFLNFGPGPNLLPEPWQNLDASHDIRKRLRFNDESTRAILAEHVIEHVPFLQGLRFFGEALRVLEPGGILRVAFPDIGRFLRIAGGETDRITLALNVRAEAYGVGIAARPHMGWIGAAVDGMQVSGIERGALYQMLTGWGHQMAWTEQSAAGALLVVGFARVQSCVYNSGEIAGVDGHHRDVGPELAEMESTVLEAMK